MYTIDSEYQAAIKGNYLAENRENEMLVALPGAPTAFDRDNYAMCRENQPHDLFPPCTSCYGALQEDGMICRLDDECPLVALDNLHLCPDCGKNLASCHAQSASESK